MEENRAYDGMNASEKKLYDAMIRAGLDPISEYPISDMTVDFAFPKEKLVIEVNGPHHQKADVRRQDIRRGYVLRREGWSRRNFTAKQCWYFPDDVAQTIKRALKKKRSEGTAKPISGFDSDMVRVYGGEKDVREPYGYIDTLPEKTPKRWFDWKFLLYAVFVVIIIAFMISSIFFSAPEVIVKQGSGVECNNFVCPPGTTKKNNIGMDITCWCIQD